MKFNSVGIVLVVLAFGVSALFYASLPEMMPMHWNIRGEIDNYESKQWAAWFLPILTGVMWGLFQILPKFDPKKENYKKFSKEWQAMQLLIVGFLVFIHGIVLWTSVKPTVKMLPLMFSGLGILFGVIGYLLPRTRQNYFVGIKTPWTLTDEDNWKKTHDVGGKSFLAGGILFMINAVFPIFPPGWLFGLIITMAVLPVGYSLWLYKSHK